MLQNGLFSQFLYELNFGIRKTKFPDRLSPELSYDLQVQRDLETSRQTKLTKDAHLS